MAASFGAFLLAGGAKGKRLALPNAEMMIHQPFSGGVKGQATDVKIMSDYMQKKKKKVSEILANNTGRSLDEITRDTERDHFFTAKEAKIYGPIDGIMDQKQIAGIKG